MSEEQRRLLEQQLWNIANTLRGKMDADEFRDYILGFIFYKYLSEKMNAYADEILWHAQLHPFRKRTRLTPEEIDRLHTAMRSTLLEAVVTVRREMGDDVHLKPRDFFAVHLRGGQACPRCGTTISEISANQRVTSFCRQCQPGGLLRGMTRPKA